MSVDCCISSKKLIILLFQLLNKDSFQKRGWLHVTTQRLWTGSRKRRTSANIPSNPNAERNAESHCIFVWHSCFTSLCTISHSIVDEATDKSNKEQVVICLWWVDSSLEAQEVYWTLPSSSKHRTLFSAGCDSWCIAKVKYFHYKALWSVLWWCINSGRDQEWSWNSDFAGWRQSCINPPLWACTQPGMLRYHQAEPTGA